MIAWFRGAFALGIAVLAGCGSSAIAPDGPPDGVMAPDAPGVCSAPTWANISPTPRPAAWPSARSAGRLVYDPTRERVLLWGGYDTSGNRLMDLWEWDGTAFTSRTPDPLPAGWPPGTFQTAAFDSRRNKLVVFLMMSRETYEWDPAGAWTRAASGGPPPLSGPGMEFDAARGVVVLFGGYNNDKGDVDNEIWEWNGTSWSNRTPTPRPSAWPSPRQSPLVYDATREKILLFGGGTGTPVTLADLWEWDGASWTDRTSPGPDPRANHGFIYESLCQRMVLYGGAREGQVLGDAWFLDPEGPTWEAQATPTPGLGVNPAMAFDAARGQTLLFGGTSGDELWALRAR